ncbi:MAG TPA: hypothetical protein PK595_02965 [Bacteroidota bacterium]|jgi:hypothetical protein|nr:hypothetical protein [Bacteroidota bacterium]
MNKGIRKVFSKAKETEMVDLMQASNNLSHRLGNRLPRWRMAFIEATVFASFWFKPGKIPKPNMILEIYYKTKI